MTEASGTTGEHAGLSYTDLGSGPPVLFVHGLISDHRTWASEMQVLSGTYRVIAPDLFGHGGSAESPGDYSLSSHAAALRDLLDALGLARVAVVGHSLGGGIAMQLAYLFPDRVGALVLVSSGGLGPDLNPALRAATLPGSEWVLPLFGARWVRTCGDMAIGLLNRVGLPPVSPSTEAAWSGMATFGDAGNRKAFLATTRSVIDVKGQSVSALPRLAMFADRPVLVVWGGRDRLIPPSHASAIKAALPHSTVEIFSRAGHFPHLDEPDRFHRVLLEFLMSAPVAKFTGDRSRPFGTRREVSTPVPAIEDLRGVGGQ